MVHTFFYISSHFPSLFVQYLSFTLTYGYDFRFPLFLRQPSTELLMTFAHTQIIYMDNENNLDPAI